MHYTEEQRLAHQQLREETSSIKNYVDLARYCLRDISVVASTDESTIAAAEVRLNIKFPKELRRLWMESDGLFWNGVPLVMPVSTLVTENLQFRAGDLCNFYMSFDSLLVFSETGTGDLFFYPIQWNGRIRSAIFLFDHETDSREYFAYNLRDLLISLAIGKY